MISFKELIQSCQAMAINWKLNPTEESVWRSICRYYSTHFNTPLHEVMEMDPEEVILHYYESKLEEVDPDEHTQDLLESIYSIEDPEYEIEREKELDEFVKDSNEEEEERVKAGKPIHPAMANETPTQNSLLKDEKIFDHSQPKGGHIDLSYLEREEMRSGGFDDER